MSSCFLSEPMDVSKYGVIYGGVQKNIGPAGVVIVIIREDLIREDVLPETPTIMRYDVQAKLDPSTILRRVTNLYLWQGLQMAEEAGRTGSYEGEKRAKGKDPLRLSGSEQAFPRNCPQRGPFHHECAVRYRR